MKNILVVFVFCCAACFVAGCTLHFKAKDVELQGEGMSGADNHTYELKELVLLDG